MLRQKLNRFSSITIAGTATVALFFFASQTKAYAGQGGLAAGVSFTVDAGGAVNSVSAATAIGKTDAAAVTFGDGGFSTTSAGALGSSSPITITNLTSTTVDTVQSSGSAGDTQLNTAQANAINNGTDANFSINLGTTSGDRIINVPAAGN